MKWNLIEERLKNQGLTVFTSQELRRATNLTPASVKQLLIRYVKRGLILKLKDNRGLYCLKNISPDPWIVANKLYRPSYISLETALAHYGVIPESIYGITSVSPIGTRTFHTMDRAFLYHKIKRAAFTGAQPVTKENSTILIAEPEKAMADFLYLVYLGKKEMNDRIRWSILKRVSLFSYLKLFKRRGLESWANHVISKHD